MRLSLTSAVALIVSGWIFWAESSAAQGPVVSILTPTNGSVFGPVDMTFTSSATSAVSVVTRVEYYGDGVLFGQSSNAPYAVTWNDPPHGYRRVVAHAHDNLFNIVQSAPVYLKIGFAPAPGLARGPYLQSGSSTGIVVRWRTDWFTDSVVRYGTNEAALSGAVTNVGSGIDHEMNLTGLLADTVYFYSIGSSTQVLAGGAPCFFRTAPEGARPMRIWVIGDSGTSDSNQVAVRDGYYQATGPLPTDLLLMLGDNAYGSGLDSQFQSAVFNMYGDLLRRTPVWPTLGNHDAGDDFRNPHANARDYLEIFTLPTRGDSGGVPSGTEFYYSFDYGNIHFVCLDSFTSDNSLDGAMASWLREDLAATDKEWIIAFWHHPPYTWGTHDSDTEPFHYLMRERLVPILEAYGVDLILGGHSHNYERSMLLNGHYGFSWTLQPGMIVDAGFGRTNQGGAYRKPAGGLGANQGCVYVVCGCSGEGGLGEGYPLHPAMKLNRGGYGSVILNIDGLRLDAQFLRPSGVVDDYFTIDKSADTTIRPALQIDRATNGIVLSWPSSRPAYFLESAPAVPSTNWHVTEEFVNMQGRRHVVTVPATNQSRFFQLRRQP